MNATKPRGREVGIVIILEIGGLTGFMAYLNATVLHGILKKPLLIQQTFGLSL